MKRRMCRGLVTWFMLAGVAANGQVDAFKKLLIESRLDLKASAAGFSGSGAAVLNKALADAKYILIGEDHGTAEIAAFTAAVCDVVAPQAYAVEAGPLAVEIVSASLQQKDRIERLAAAEAKYPDSIAFLNLKNENDLAAHCQAASNGKFELWGLDQEFMGSAGLIFDRILATNPGPAAVAEIHKLQEQNRIDAVKAHDSGDPRQLMLMAVPDAELEHARDTMARSANPEARRLMEQMIESHQIYQKNASGNPDSNRQRALLMKRTLESYLRGNAARGTSGKILFKFGDWHLYRGFNPLWQLDIGAYVSELADGEGNNSLHIIILGAKGSHLGYAGHGKPYEPQQFELIKDESYGFMRPFTENQVANGWTLYDLRKLRFERSSKLDQDTERLIYGYDLLVVIPEVSGATQIR